VRRPEAWIWPPLGLALSFAVLVFSVTVVTFPGERQEKGLPSWRLFPAIAEWENPATKQDAKGNPRTASIRDWLENAERLSLHDWLFNEELDSVSRRRFPFSNTLVLPGFNIYEGLNIDDPDKAKWHDFIFRARGRDLRGAIFDFASMPRVDFTGANLEGASLQNAQLQGASLDRAQLQGASLLVAQLQGALLNDARLRGAWLVQARLQGASLDRAQLEGVSLDSARLQGASLIRAQLQGASLDSAELQGVWLIGAQLRGASLGSAQLQGAFLDGAELQGASLVRAQLQGASLQQASLLATDLQGALLWRTNAPPGVIRPDAPAAIRLVNSVGDWRPVWLNEKGDIQSWDDKAYQDLRKAIEALSAGVRRDLALQRISRLDCASSDKTLASCDPAAPAPPGAVAWRQTLEAASIDEGAYEEALVKTLRSLVCSGGDDAIYLMHGGGFRTRLKAAGAAASDLIGDLTNKESKTCPVASALSDADQASFLQIKQRIEKAGKP
jgi:uncharacterized protein YjbI with pentapeptide repeats